MEVNQDVLSVLVTKYSFLVALATLFSTPTQVVCQGLSVCLTIPIQGHGLEERDWDVEAKANNNHVDRMIEQKH
mgnify:CR=1 FL=1